MGFVAESLEDTPFPFSIYAGTDPDFLSQRSSTLHARAVLVYNLSCPKALDNILAAFGMLPSMKVSVA